MQPAIRPLPAAARLISLRTLLAPECRVQPTLAKQVLVRACFDDAFALKDVDGLGMRDGGEAVRNRDGDEARPAASRSASSKCPMRVRLCSQ